MPEEQIPIQPVENPITTTSMRSLAILFASLSLLASHCLADRSPLRRVQSPRLLLGLLFSHP
jgi:hypothetical protein